MFLFCRGFFVRGRGGAAGLAFGVLGRGVGGGGDMDVCLLLARPWGRFVRKCEMERGDLV